jgi:aspartyl-tRNA(Asn)/glutamyl-tRNA(Gln) amidotransferase subunit C
MAGSLTRGDVERIADLARLALGDDETALFARQLAGILAYAEQIQSVDTDGVPERSHADGASAGGRDDEVRPSLERQDALAAAPVHDESAGLFKVPRVLG